MGGSLSKREGGLRALPVSDEGLTDQSISSTEAIEGNNGLLNEPLNDNGRETDSDSEYFSATDCENDGDGELNPISPPSRMDPNRPRKLQSILKNQGFNQPIDKPPGLMSKWLPSWFHQYKKIGISAIPGAGTSTGGNRVSFRAPEQPRLTPSTADGNVATSQRDDQDIDMDGSTMDENIDENHDTGTQEESDSNSTTDVSATSCRTSISPRSSLNVSSTSSSKEAEEIDPDDLLFKETLIGRIEKRKNGKTSMKRDADDPRHQLDYIPSSDTFSIGGIIVLFDKKALICSECDKRYEGRSSIPTWNAQMYNLEKAVTTHVNHVHLDAFQCTVCSKSLSCFYTWQQHMEMHLKDFVCNICGKKMNSRIALNRHTLSHMNETEKKRWMVKMGKSVEPVRHVEEIQCPQCPKTFATVTGLNQHVRMIHGNRKKVKCPDCRKSILEQNYRRYHRVFVCPDEDHQDVKRVQCPLCIDTFKNDSSFKNHMRTIHAPQRKNELKNGEYCCSRCKKVCRNRKALAQHKFLAHQKKK